MKESSRFLLVWHWPPSSWRLGSRGPFPFRGGQRGLVFRWRICLGPLEIRRWALPMVAPSHRDKEDAHGHELAHNDNPRHHPARNRITSARPGLPRRRLPTPSQRLDVIDGL